MAQKIVARSQFDEHPKIGLINCKKEESKTQQSAEADSNINNILKKYENTGELPDLIKTDPRYGDFSAVPTYQEALNVVHLAEEQFMALNAHVRKRFSNDPVEFLTFIGDEKNADEIIRMGLASPRKVDTGSNLPPSGEAPKGAGEGNQRQDRGEGTGNQNSGSKGESGTNQGAKR